MRELNLRRQSLDIRGVVAEASLALARLDADRLEELALTCQTLNQIESDVDHPNSIYDHTLARQVREAAHDMRILGRVLESTRANLAVLRRLRQLRGAKIEYSEAQARGWAPPDPVYGDN